MESHAEAGDHGAARLAVKPLTDAIDNKSGFPATVRSVVNSSLSVAPTSHRPTPLRRWWGLPPTTQRSRRLVPRRTRGRPLPSARRDLAAPPVEPQTAPSPETSAETSLFGRWPMTDAWTWPGDRVTRTSVGRDEPRSRACILTPRCYRHSWGHGGSPVARIRNAQGEQLRDSARSPASVRDAGPPCRHGPPYPVASVPSVPGSRDGPVLVRLGGVPRPAHQYPRAVGNGETAGGLGVGPESPTLGT